MIGKTVPPNTPYMAKQFRQITFGGTPDSDKSSLFKYSSIISVLLTLSPCERISPLFRRQTISSMMILISSTLPSLPSPLSATNLTCWHNNWTLHNQILTKLSVYVLTHYNFVLALLNTLTIHTVQEITLNVTECIVTNPNLTIS